MQKGFSMNLLHLSSLKRNTISSRVKPTSATSSHLQTRGPDPAKSHYQTRHDFRSTFFCYYIDRSLIGNFCNKFQKRRKKIEKYSLVGHHANIETNISTNQTFPLILWTCFNVKNTVECAILTTHLWIYECSLSIHNLIQQLPFSFLTHFTIPTILTREADYHIAKWMYCFCPGKVARNVYTAFCGKLSLIQCICPIYSCMKSRPGHTSNLFIFQTQREHVARL